MAVKGYEEFAEGQALRVGGQFLVDAMRKQISGEDQDIAEVYWLVQRASEQNPVEVYANVQADFGGGQLHFSVDEKDTSGDSEYASSMDFYLKFTDKGVILGHGGDEFSGAPEMVRELLDQFVAAAQPSQQQVEG